MDQTSSVGEWTCSQWAALLEDYVGQRISEDVA